MSLLIKALEQAAKDRKAARVEPPADAPAAPGEPTLEPPPPPRPPEGRLQNRVSAAEYASSSSSNTAPQSSAPQPSARQPSAPQPSTPPAAAAQARSGPVLSAPAPERRAASSLADLAEIDAQQQRARAATVVQAGGGSAANLLGLFRGNPVMLVAGLAVLFGVFYGIYVYLQIAQPGMFTRQAATKPPEAAPPSPPPVPAPEALPPATPEAPPAPSSGIAGAPPIEPPKAQNPLAGGPSSGMIAGTGAAPSPAAPPPAVAPAPGPGPIPSGAVIGSTAEPRRAPVAETPRPVPSETPRAASAERAPLAERATAEQRNAAAEQPPEAVRERAGTRTERAQFPAARRGSRAAPADPEALPAGRERITVSQSNLQPRLNPTLAQAYSQLQSGNVDDARALYTKLSQAEPLNIDALLGLAYIAAQDNRSDEAVRIYLRILQLNPRHALAQAALIGLIGRADPTASEGRLKQLIAAEPSAFLHFVLGNLYADQSQWAQAQQSYFQAHRLEPDNPDYAYNLAVGLDHLSQGKPALNFYRRAEQLASAQGRSNFNLAHARDRIRILSSQLE